MVPRRSARDWVVDVLAVLIAVGGGAALLAAGPERMGTLRPVLVADVVVGLACSAALWWRRRLPVQVAVTVGLAAGFSAMAGMPAVIALFTVAVQRRAGVVAAVVAVHAAAGVAYFWIRPDGSQLWLNLAPFALILASLVAWGMFVRARRQLVISLRTAPAGPSRSSSCGSTRRASWSGPGSPGRCMMSWPTGSRWSACRCAGVARQPGPERRRGVRVGDPGQRPRGVAGPAGDSRCASRRGAAG